MCGLVLGRVWTRERTQLQEPQQQLVRAVAPYDYLRTYIPITIVLQSFIRAPVNHILMYCSPMNHTLVGNKRHS